MRLMRVTAGRQHALDRPGQVVVQAGQRGAVEGAEAQHHALLVRLHAIEAAGEPERHDDQRDQRQAAPAGEPRRAGTAAAEAASG